MPKEYEAKFLNIDVDTIKKIQAKFNGRTVVVRSSASDEDGSLRAAAGEYDSVLSIDSNDYESLSQAIETVINSINNYYKREAEGKFEFICLYC